MNKYQSIKALLGIVIVILVTRWATLEVHDFFPSGMGSVSHDTGPVLFDDPNDISYWPSIDELQWFAQTKPDGLFRKNSQDDYEARRWVWYGNQNAMILWPEDAK